MSFSFDIGLTEDKDKVRFHIGDTDTNGAYLADETIDALIASEGSIGAAVLACIKYIITQLSSPSFKLDWLSVTNQEARKGFESMLKVKAQEFGIALSGLSATASISLPYREDSGQYSTSTRTQTTVDNTDSYDGSSA